MTSRELNFVSDTDLLEKLAESSDGNENEDYDSDKDPEYNVTRDEPNSDSDSENANVAATPQIPPNTPPAVNELLPVDGIQGSQERSRKRKLSPLEWKKNKKSAEYNNGKRYKNKNGTVTRDVGDRCYCKKRKCREITDDERIGINTAFWSLCSQNKRANYIIAHISKVPKKRQTLYAAYNRGDNVKYFMPRSNGAKLEVCKKFFQTTLCISDKMISYNLKKAVDGVKPPTTRPPPVNKISEEALQTIIDHIKSYPTVESHYCRSTTLRRYLDAGLNKTKMYQMYKDSQFHNNTVKQHLYSKIFDEKFNFGFHKPSKDLCDFCDKYKKAQNASLVTEDMEQENIQHLRRKTEARESKEMDKTAENTMAVTCDLQQVMTAPKFSAGSTYYKRKLNVYNFTVYELPTGEGFCYTWTEAECNRGANDIATCLVKYLEKVDQEGKYEKVIIYSDTCGGQNRNRIVCTAIASFLTASTTIISVEQKFFESGHSHMECDSMHSAIEGAFKSIEVALPSDYMSCMLRARRKKPYCIIEIDHTVVRNYEQLNDQAFKKDTFKGIMKAHAIKYLKVNQNIDISMGANIGGDLNPIAWRKRGATKSLTDVRTAYQAPCGIDKDKKGDLLFMLDLAPSRTIYKLYYESLAEKN